MQCLLELTFLRSISLSAGLTAAPDQPSFLADLEVKLKAAMEELAGFVKAESLNAETVEREALAPFLSGVCRRSKNGSLKPKLEHLASRAGLKLRLWVGEAAPAQTVDLSTPKPQPQTTTIFAALAKAAG